MTNVDTQYFNPEIEHVVQIAQALSSGTPRKRKLLSKLQTCEKKRRRLQNELDKTKRGRNQKLTIIYSAW